MCTFIAKYSFWTVFLWYQFSSCKPFQFTLHCILNSQPLRGLANQKIELSNKKLFMCPAVFRNESKTNPVSNFIERVTCISNAIVCSLLNECKWFSNIHFVPEIYENLHILTRRKSILTQQCVVTISRVPYVFFVGIFWRKWKLYIFGKLKVLWIWKPMLAFF